VSPRIITTMVRRILIPYLVAGFGHLVHAQSIAAFLQRMRPSWEVRLMDAARDLDDAMMQRTFVDLWRIVLAMPAPLAGLLFAGEQMAPRLARQLNRRRLATAVPKAAAYLANRPVDLVMSTHWACAHLFSMARGARALPLWVVYGELERAYSIAECGADRYFCFTPKVVDGLVGLGVPPSAIRQVPLVFDPAAVRPRLPPDAVRRQLGIPSDHFVVVMSLGGEGIGRPLPFIQAFARQTCRCTLVVLTGRNEKQLHALRRQVKSPRVRVLGFQEDLGPLVAVANALAGKVGTGYVSLAVARGIPFLVTHIGAPHEMGTMRYVVENGYGWWCERPQAFAAKVAELAGASRSGSPPREGRIPPNGAEAIAAEIVEALS
jgi:UDP-N-acetylglucosamine:LPS N-acetylglucosamine transferase